MNIFTNKFLKGDELSHEHLDEHHLIDNIKQCWETCPKMNLRISPNTIKQLSVKLSNGAGHDGLHPVLLKKGFNQISKHDFKLYK